MMNQYHAEAKHSHNLVTIKFYPWAYWLINTLYTNYINIDKTITLLQKINAIVHPAVLPDGEKWHKRQKTAPYNLKESAPLFEIGSQKFYDKTIMVFAPKSLRLERVMKRDGLTKEAVEARMSKQMSDEQKRQLADYVIINDGIHLLLPQIVALHQQFLEGSAEMAKAAD